MGSLKYFFNNNNNNKKILGNIYMIQSGCQYQFGSAYRLSDTIFVSYSNFSEIACKLANLMLLFCNYVSLK